MKKAHHLLIVDDEELTRQLTSLKLREKGYTITEACSGSEAFKLIGNNDFDLVLLDFQMPEMNGLDVLTKIRLQYSILQLPVIMVTANKNNDDIINAFHIGANDYLIKPLNFEVAEARIRTQLTQSYFSKLQESFLQFAGHDLKKPLLVIQDISEELKRTLSKNYSIDEDTLSLLDLILSTTDTTQEMLRGFLDENSQRIHKVLNNQIIYLNDIIENLTHLNLKYCQKKSISLKSNLATDDYLLYSDLFRITQIIDNLIGNAIKFSPPDTEIEIITYIKDKTIFLEVKDEGPGIRDDEFHMLFTKHAKLSNKPTGNEQSTGIGLALCHELASQINAKLSARNNQSRGATFQLEINLLEEH